MCMDTTNIGQILGISDSSRYKYYNSVNVAIFHTYSRQFFYRYKL